MFQKKNTNNAQVESVNSNSTPSCKPIKYPDSNSTLKFTRHQLREQYEEDEQKDIFGLFLLKTANQWLKEASKRPIPKMLFDEFWYEGELCILFADSNVGKSILAVQIGNSIASGIKVPGFKLDAVKQPILYFDFELSDKQFENRYSINYANHYDFDSNFLRVEINPNAEIPPKQSFERYLGESIEKSINRTGSRILIIDNITYLRSETEKAKDALPLMKELKALKQKYDLSILALAHTPKRDMAKPLTRNDLQGSKMLMNFTDSSFAIGESFVCKSFRYLKQIKGRQAEKNYEGDNVCLCQIHKPENFLEFELLDYGIESEHLKELPFELLNDNLVDKVKNLYNTGMKQREIAEQLKLSVGTVNKYIKR